MDAEDFQSELVNTNVGDALKELLKKKYPDKIFQVLPEHTAVTMDYKPERYRVYYNRFGIITEVVQG